MKNARQKLAVVGAGPKALAIAAKNQVLAGLGFETPEIHIFERRSVGANWSGVGGFTNGKLHLGTSPEKDIGFPYKTQGWSEDVCRAIDGRMMKYSWGSFLISRAEYSQWIDRGRPAPTHGLWARYLQWVAAQLAGHVQFHFGAVTAISKKGPRWMLNFVRNAQGESALLFDGVVITGPGKSRLPASLPDHPRVLSVEKFWQVLPDLTDLKGARVALLGTGENAASVAMTLVSEGKGAQLEVISPTGMAFSRGESFQENNVYSDPISGKWNLLSEEDKRQFINRTDRGVFSSYANAVLGRAELLEILPGRVTEITVDGKSQPLVNWVYDGRTGQKSYDYVIVATGFDQMGLLKELMDEEAQADLRRLLGTSDLCDGEMEKRIGQDMSVGTCSPKLHLPMLSGMNQGPGFANLSSLGTLSDRLLETYVRPPAVRRQFSTAVMRSSANALAACEAIV